jgi:hypothetical protein
MQTCDFLCQRIIFYRQHTNGQKILMPYAASRVLMGIITESGMPRETVFFFTPNATGMDSFEKTGLSSSALSV